MQSWLTAKVLALLAYIILGSIALRRGPTRRARIAAWVMTLLVFGYIVAVARTRSALPWTDFSHRRVCLFLQRTVNWDNIMNVWSISNETAQVTPYRASFRGSISSCSHEHCQE